MIPKVQRVSFSHYTLTALTALTALTLGCALATPAIAQSAGDPDADNLEDKPKAAVGSRTAAAAAERARQKREAEAEKAAADPAKYPQATRTEPKLKATVKGGKALRAILASYDQQKYQEVITGADALAAQSYANTYDKSYAYQLAANALLDIDDKARATEYYRKAIEANGLDNNGHYHVMYNLAVTQNQLGRHADALGTIERFTGETKAETAETATFKAGLLSKLGRAAEAIPMYERMLAQKPNDKTLLLNAVALYQQAGQKDRANALLETVRKQGLLTAEDGVGYRLLYVGYLNAGKLKQAVEVIDEGIAKGAVQPSQTLAGDYAAIAERAYNQANDSALAIELFRRAAKVSSNGEAALNLAKVLKNEGRVAEAKSAAREALAKGIKRPEEANRIISATAN